MSRLIDADTLWKDVTSNIKYCFDFLEIIERQPTIEPEPQWIPVSERLPEEGVEVLCCFRNGNNYKIIVSKRTDFNYWSSVGRTDDTIAWIPLPEPYTESNGWTTTEEMSGWIKEVNE